MHFKTFVSDTGSPDSEEWHAWRRQGIGGSDAIIIAVSEGLVTEAPSWVRSINHLWKEKRGEDVDAVISNFAIRRGREGEEIARELYVKQTGIFVLPAFGENEERPFVRSSFDGIDLLESVIAEIKCPGEANHQAAHDGKVVDYYKPQLAHQGLTAWSHPDCWDKARQLHYVSCAPENRDIAIVRHGCHKYARIAAALWDLEEAFWNRVVSGEPPGGWDLHELCRRYLQVERVYIDRKAVADAAKAEATAALGEFTACKEQLQAAFLASGQRKLEAEGVSMTKSEPRPVVSDPEKALLELGFTEEDLRPYRAQGPVAYDRMAASMGVTDEALDQYRDPGPLDADAAIKGLGVQPAALEPYMVKPAARVTIRKLKSAEPVQEPEEASPA